jgi:glycerol-3-phosphate O-acyltransferase
VRPDDITAAVLARDEVARYVRAPSGGPEFDASRRVEAMAARQRVEGYLDELRTTQRYRFYRALQHPLYPILRKVTRVPEHIERAVDATRRGHVVYVSNHKSHLDWLVEPIVLDDHGIRLPLMAAGINLFGGALGLLHKHVTGAIPIRRDSKDPIYLATLKAYVAEILKRRDVLYYAEGGRSYRGELKSPKTGLLQAAMGSDRSTLAILPMAVSYDLVLEEKMLVHQATSRAKRPFSQEVAEMARLAVGYQSRAFVTFGQPIPLSEYDPDSRRDLVRLVQRTQHEIGRLYKVLPTALVATAMRPQATRADLAARIDDLLGLLAAAGANLSVQSGRHAADDGVDRLIDRGVLVAERQRLRVRDRLTLRYYARTIEHLLPGDAKGTH